MWSVVARFALIYGGQYYIAFGVAESFNVFLGRYPSITSGENIWTDTLSEKEKIN